MAKYTIGIDVGGTNIKFGLVNSKGKIISRSRLETKTFARTRSKLISAITDEIKRLMGTKRLKASDIEGIGFGLPGLINPKQGVVTFLPNIPGWKNVPLARLVQLKLNIKTYIDNDVNLITLAEWRFGAGVGCQNLLCMTLGTGVGGGLILDNALYRGEGFVAGELGHMPISHKGPACNCGGYGCLECFVGNQKLFDKIGRIFKNKSMRTQDAFALANKGNTRAIRFWKETATYIGNGLVGVVNLLNPKLIIIGGGVANNYKFMHTTIKDVLVKRCMKVQGKMVRIVRAKLGDDAGIIGAHVLVHELKKSTKGKRS